MITHNMTSVSAYLPNENEGGAEDFPLANGCCDKMSIEKESNGFLMGAKEPCKVPSSSSNSTRMKVQPDDALLIPFPLLPGENVEQRIVCSEASVILTNYRLFACLPESFHNIPVRTIEYVEMRELTVVHVYCKFGKVIRLCLDTPEDCADLWRHITSLEASQLKSEDLFAFKYFNYLNLLKSNGIVSKISADPADCEAAMFVKDIRRMGFNTATIWRTSEINSKFEVCKTYPKFHIVPACVTDDDLLEVAQFRSMRRFPSVIWRSKINGCVIARCSQPEVGWFGWRCEKDEYLLSAIAQAAKLDSVVGSNLSSLSVHELKPQTFLLVDARSYATAVANRAKGGGCECQEYYPTCDIQFMGLVNIHAIRKSFQSVRSLSVYGQEQSNWYSTLEKTGWLHYLSALIRSALSIVEAISIEKRSAVVHCTDGWDRTTQLVSLAELLLDPYYRTIQGFCVLVEREWLEFGHKFADRCGHSPDKNINEISPVFYQWLDAVYQIMKQFPSAFEFNESFLLKLVHHIYSCLFGTFLCNSIRERHQLKVKSKTASIWTLLLSGRRDFINFLYVVNEKVLYPNHHIRNMQFWENVFIGDKQYPYTQRCSDTSKSASADFSDSGNFTHTSVSSNGGLKFSNTKMISHENIQLSPVTIETSNAVNIAPAGEDNKLLCERENALSVSCQAVHSSYEENSLIMNSSCEHPVRYNSNTSNISNFHPSSCTDNRTPIDLKDFTKQSLPCALPCVENDEPSEDDANSTLSDNPNEKSKMTDSVKTLTGEIGRPPSFDDTCILAKGFQEQEVGDPSQILMDLDHRPNAMRKVYSSPDSPRTARLMRTKSVPDIMTSSLGIDTDNKYPSLEGNKVLKDLIKDLSRYIDCDGLTIFHNYIDYKLLNIEERHSQEMAKLQKRIQIERQARIGLQQQLQKLTVREGVEYSPATFSDASHDDLLSLPGSTSGGRSSVSSLSNDDGWEQVQYDDVEPTRWVPDHVSSSCALCGQQFSVMLRRHHCRKCGAVFCDQCTSQQISVPDEQLYEPVRVCTTCYDTILHNKT